MPTGTTTLASARRHVSNMQRRVERAVAVGQPERARRLRRMILLSYEARLAAVYRAHRRGPLSPERARHLAHHLDAMRGTRDAATRHVIPKPVGGERVVYAFGPEHRALQHLVRLALEPGRPAADYTAPGRGRDRMVREVAADTARYRYWVLADIKGFYDSLNEAGAVPLLPVPAGVARNVIFGGNTPVVEHRATRTRRRRMCGRSRRRSGSSSSLSGPDGNIGPPGLVQGSACSDVAAAWILVPVIEALGGSARVYGDDIAIPARSLCEARASAETLARALRAHPGGPLQARRVTIARREDGIDLLGYMVRRRGGRLVVSPAPHKVARKVLEFDSEVAQTDSVEGAAAMLRSWRTGYPAWPNGDRWVDRMVAKARRDLC